MSILPSAKSRWRFSASTVTIKCRRKNRLSCVSAFIRGQGKAAPVLSQKTRAGAGLSSKISSKALPNDT